MTAELLHFRQPQSQRLARFGAAASVDLHCHCLPGIDDGPQTLAEAISLCEALVADGITTVVATPHQLGPYDAVTAAAIRDSAGRLAAEITARDIPLMLHIGAEIRVEDDLLRRLASGEVLALPDGGPYVLIELPHSTMFDLRGLIEAMVAAGFTPIIAHPERHVQLSRAPNLLIPWLQRGALLQVTAASLDGDFGPLAQHAAWEMLSAGWVSLIASDAHDTVNRRPSMTAAIDRIAATSGHAVARRLCVTNPMAVLDGKPILRPRVLLRGGRG